MLAALGCGNSRPNHEDVVRFIEEREETQSCGFSRAEIRRGENILATGLPDQCREQSALWGRGRGRDLSRVIK